MLLNWKYSMYMLSVQGSDTISEIWCEFLIFSFVTLNRITLFRTLEKNCSHSKYFLQLEIK